MKRSDDTPLVHLYEPPHEDGLDPLPQIEEHYLKVKRYLRASMAELGDAIRAEGMLGQDRPMHQKFYEACRLNCEEFNEFLAQTPLFTVVNANTVQSRSVSERREIAKWKERLYRFEDALDGGLKNMRRMFEPYRGAFENGHLAAKFEYAHQENVFTEMSFCLGSARQLDECLLALATRQPPRTPTLWGLS